LALTYMNASFDSEIHEVDNYFVRKSDIENLIVDLGVWFCQDCVRRPLGLALSGDCKVGDARFYRGAYPLLEEMFVMEIISSSNSIGIIDGAERENILLARMIYDLTPK
ncbi:hypothetical protein AMTR_s00159p00043980, partial [Amborella trichopoda]